MNKKLFLPVAIFLLVFLVGGITYNNLKINEDLSRDGLPISESQNGEIEAVLEILVKDLGQIWAIEFIPGTQKLLATQNEGKLFLINTENNEILEIQGVPQVDSRGQGGLLDIAISPNFEQDYIAYLTYSASGQGGFTTHLAKVKIDLDNLSITEVDVIYIARPFLSGTAHFGSRVVIDGDYLFVTIGDRGDKNFNDHASQDTSNVLGTTLRLRLDGTIPENNPFVGNPDVLDEIYSYGHRNSQGMTIHPVTGRLWQSEHGESDGDEINIIEAGGNYGWPITHTGCSYITRRPIGELPWDRDDIVNPVHYWECGSGGFPPSGMVFYYPDSGMGFQDWSGDLFVGGLASRYLAHFKLSDNGLVEQEPLLKQEGWRIRDVTIGHHNGAIYVAVEGGRASIARIMPVVKK